MAKADKYEFNSFFDKIVEGIKDAPRDIAVEMRDGFGGAVDQVRTALIDEAWFNRTGGSEVDIPVNAKEPPSKDGPSKIEPIKVEAPEIGVPEIETLDPIEHDEHDVLDGLHGAAGKDKDPLGLGDSGWDFQTGGLDQGQELDFDR